MSDIHLEEELDIPISIGALEQALIRDPSFLAKLRQAELIDARRLGNRMGRWAQSAPKPKAVQPNTKQRVF